jgi:hypothetical protein
VYLNGINMEFNKCPYCNKEIESDSLYCDQCGQELRICTHGHGFKRGKICSECGKPLILAKDVSHTKDPTKQQTVEPKHLVNNTLNARLQLLDGAVIGRRTGNYVDVFGSQGYVSGSHARLQRSASGEWSIIDLDSTNGTFLNETRLVPQRPATFNIGDIIAFYDLKFIVE